MPKKVWVLVDGPVESDRFESTAYRAFYPDKLPSELGEFPVSREKIIEYLKNFGPQANILKVENLNERSWRITTVDIDGFQIKFDLDQVELI